MVHFKGDIMSKSLEELRDEYITELAEVEKKIEYANKRLKLAVLKQNGAEKLRLEKLLNVYQSEKEDFEYSIKQLKEYCE